jgi:membrane associated rhomboid family serine protease/Flp pilus assembly protein TadD
VQHEAAQRGEESDDAPQRVIPAPWVKREASISLTQLILGANAMVFIAMVAASGPSLDFTRQVMLHFGANYGPLTLSGEWWRLVTYMFLHGGIFHIAINMWCLWNLGTLCEDLYGRWTYAAIYLITGIAGGLTSVAWNPRVLSVGASGALFGLTGALIASFYLGEFSLSGISIRGTLSSLLFFAGFSLFFGFVDPRIDNGCHIGGLVSGLALGALVARLAPQQDAPLRRVTVVAVVALALLTAGFGVRQWRGGPMPKGDPVARLQAVIKQQPNLADAHFALAQTYLARDQFPEAEAEFRRVIELQPGNLDARFDLGLVYLTETRLEDAKSAFIQILAQDRNSAEGHYGLGLVLAEQQNHSAAIDELKKAAPDTHLSGVYYEMGKSYAKLNRYDDAIAAYLNEKQKTGDSADIENALADAYQAKGMLKESQEARDLAQQLRGPATH